MRSPHRGGASKEPIQVDLHEQFGRAIGDVARTWRTKLNERLTPLGLSEAKWITLLYLSRGVGGLIEVELAKRIGIEGPTLVRLLDRLEADGWGKRKLSKTDRRSKVSVLGRKAQPVLKEIRAFVHGLREECKAGLSEREIAAFLWVF